MHSRHEWEMPVAGEKLEIDALAAQPATNPPRAAALREAAPDLIELFRTNFTRTLWQVEPATARRSKPRSIRAT